MQPLQTQLWDSAPKSALPVGRGKCSRNNQLAPPSLPWKTIGQFSSTEQVSFDVSKNDSFFICTPDTNPGSSQVPWTQIFLSEQFPEFSGFILSSRCKCGIQTTTEFERNAEARCEFRCKYFSIPMQMGTIPLFLLGDSVPGMLKWVTAFCDLWAQQFRLRDVAKMQLPGTQK